VGGKENIVDALTETGPGFVFLSCRRIVQAGVRREGILITVELTADDVRARWQVKPKVAKAQALDKAVLDVSKVGVGRNEHGQLRTIDD
jgi:hypothetical protein